MASFLPLQAARNVESRPAWDAFAFHRRRVMQEILSARTSGNDSIAILGAGNCNDLELPLVAESFAARTLVDLDLDAMQQGIARQHLPPGAFECLAADLSPLRQANGALVDLSDAAAAACQISQMPAALTGEYQLVTSVCLLSQLVEQLARLVPQTDPAFFACLTALRTAHVRQMLDLCCASGKALLVCDFVSSDTAPDLAKVPEAEFPRFARRLIEQGNFFHGLNPFAILAATQREPALHDRIQWARLSAPWRWQLLDRTYAVYALHLGKR